MRQALDTVWDRPGIELFYQFSQSKEDGVAKAERAMGEGFDTILVSGGDGTVSTIGRVLIGSNVALGVIPTGSGNGFARHFDIPLSIDRAVRALVDAKPTLIDVGVVDGTPFFVTCSMAWDAAIVRSFDRSPLRGILPYVFAGVQEFLEYRPLDIDVELEDGGLLHFRRPMVFTIANLTQYGGGARIAPQANAEDGKLELVVGLQEDAPKLIANLARLFDGSINKLPELITRTFSKLTVRRQEAGAIQVDGELVQAGAEVEVGIIPRALRVLVPG
jgi:diacylglycerol kinase (ATP)